MAEMGLLIATFMQQVRAFMEDMGDLTKLCSMEMPADPPKDTRLSEPARKKANELYVKSNHDSALHTEILHYYNKSIAHAPIGSEELASAYGNKSALLRHLRKYRECICEIDKALKLPATDVLKVKLLCRKAECLTALGSADNRGSLEKARFILSKIDESVQSDFKILIDQTEKIIEEEKLEVPKMMKENDKGRGQALKKIVEVEAIKPSSCFKVESARGRPIRLVAARDLKVGEILVAEKPYRNILEDSKAMIHCSHCLYILWTAVPCNTCCWSLYCSEKCRDEALKEYHDLECPCLPYLRFMLEFDECQEFHLALSVFLKAVKETGGITQLQAEMKAIHNRKNKAIELDEKFKSLKFLCGLPLRSKVDDDAMKYGIFCVVNVISVVAKCTTIFGRSFNFRELKKLASNNDVVFAAALVSRFYFSRPSRCGPNGFYARLKLDDRKKCQKIFSSDLPMNYAFGSLAQLTTAGCLPNVEVCHTYGDFIIVYPIRPIKRGSKIIKPLSSFYEFTPESVRQAVYRNIHNCECDCQACTEKWSQKLGDPMKELKVSDNESATVKKLVQEISEIKSNISQKTDLDIKLVPKMKKITRKAWEQCLMPSRVIVEAVRTMIKVFEIFYGIAEVPQIDIPSQCKI